MRVNPAAAIGAVTGASSDEGRQPAPAIQSSGNAIPSQPDSETRPNQKKQDPLNVPEPAPSARDAVEVQRETGNQIVIKYFDRAGKEIFHVPSAQVLGLQRAIERALKEQEQSKESVSDMEAIRQGGTGNER